MMLKYEYYTGHLLHLCRLRKIMHLMSLEDGHFTTLFVLVLHLDCLHSTHTNLQRNNFLGNNLCIEELVSYKNLQIA